MWIYAWLVYFMFMSIYKFLLITLLEACGSLFVLILKFPTKIHAQHSKAYFWMHTWIHVFYNCLII